VFGGWGRFAGGDLKASWIGSVALAQDYTRPIPPPSTLVMHIRAVAGI